MNILWKKDRLGNICHKITDGTHKTPIYQDSGVVFLSARNIKNGILSFANHKFISEEEHLELTKRCKPEMGDVMLSKSGSLGDAVAIPKLPFSFSIFESLALIKLKKDVLLPEYLQQYLNSPLSKRYFLVNNLRHRSKASSFSRFKKDAYLCAAFRYTSSCN